MSCTTVPESQSSPESPECGRSAAEATSQTLKKSSAWIQNIFPSGISDWIRNLLQKKLPFRLQTQLSAGKVRLIDEVKVVNIEEWNADPELGRYPIKQRKTEESEKVKNEE